MVVWGLGLYGAWFLSPTAPSGGALGLRPRLPLPWRQLTCRLAAPTRKGWSGDRCGDR